MNGHKRKISVIGLGYVGLPVAVAFGMQGRVIGFDVNENRINELKNNHDVTLEVDTDALKNTDVEFTTDASVLAEADFHIVAVPTPVDDSNRPDLTPLFGASRSVGGVLKRGDIVVYESTVYPGATEEDCIPILEQESGLTAGQDFTVGYSPERINPGDHVHNFTSITKVVSGQDQATLDIVASVYESVVEAGVHRAPTIKVAEAAKVIENTQRDVNIALMNELSMIFERMDVDTRDVLAAAGSKWNFLPFTPGLVGGHCIGVDPYYLTHKAAMLGHQPRVILSGRSINDGMGSFLVSRIVKDMIAQDIRIKGSTVTVLGLSFKEDVPDLRNTRVIDIIAGLKSYGINVQVHDPLVDASEAMDEYGLELTDRDALKPAQGVVLAVTHSAFIDAGWDGINSLLENGQGVVADVKGVLDKAGTPEGISLRRL